MKPDYHFTAFWALDEPAAALDFYQGHLQALQRFGLGAMASSHPDWLDNPGVLVILARTPDGSLAGGVRVHCSRPGRPLPLVAALAPSHPDVVTVLASAAAQGMAEACGLWVAAGHSGRGLAQLLTRYSVALGLGLAPALYSLAAPHTLGMVQSLGFEPVRPFGKLGTVPYPTPDYLSTLAEWRPADTFHYADAVQRARIRSLRALPAQLCCERAGGQDVWVRYTPPPARLAPGSTQAPGQYLEQAA